MSREIPQAAPARRINARAAIVRLFQTRVAVVVASLLYMVAMYQAHAGYLDATWAYYGFTHFPVDFPDGLAMTLLVLAGAMVVPRTLHRPSSIFLVMLFAAVYVPTMVITAGTRPDSMEHHAAILVALAAGFGIACVAMRLQRDPGGVPAALPGRPFVLVLLVFWAVAAVVLVVLYASVMRLVGEQELYEQRAAGASTSTVIGYTQTYFSNVVSPALIAVGLMKRRWWLVGVGIAGCVLMFAINAQRTSLLLPVAIIGMYLMFVTRVVLLRSVAFLVGALAATVSIVCSTYAASAVSNAVAQYLVFRMLAVPGRTLAQYYEVFSIGGYTWWSHVRGISAIVPAPRLYADDPKWPALGYFIGDWYYDSPIFNINAHLFSGDGAAAAGPAGIVVTGIVLAAWLFVLDRASRGWNRDFVLLAVFPMAIGLINGPLFTVLLSFGGLFWTLVFLLYKPRGVAAGGHRP